jgi:hypothetical protein
MKAFDANQSSACTRPATAKHSEAVSTAIMGMVGTVTVVTIVIKTTGVT